MFEGTLVKKFEGRPGRGSAPRATYSFVTTATSARGLIARQEGHGAECLKGADLMICQIDILKTRSSAGKSDDHDI
jgi:hypothetical protein